MRQRLGIAQALLERPKVLILDEPANALDSDGIGLLRDILIKQRSEGVTILLASHNAEDIKLLRRCISDGIWSAETVRHSGNIKPG